RKRLGITANKTTSPKRQTEPNHEALGWYRSFLKDLQPGQFIDQPINRGGYWILIKMIEKQKEEPFRFKLQSVIVPKENYDIWKQKEAEGVWVFPRPQTPVL